jgi:hypothetical protein
MQQQREAQVGDECPAVVARRASAPIDTGTPARRIAPMRGMR